MKTCTSMMRFDFCSVRLVFHIMHSLSFSLSHTHIKQHWSKHVDLFVNDA